MIQPSHAGVHSCQGGGDMDQRTQFNPQLFAHPGCSQKRCPPSTQHPWNQSLPPLLKSTISFPRQARGQLSLSHTPSPVQPGSPRRKQRLGFKALLQMGRQSNLVTAHPKRCTCHQACRSELDRQTQVRPQKMHPSPPAHTEMLEHLRDRPCRQCGWGTIPSP